jgi:hypothetical protein
MLRISSKLLTAVICVAALSGIGCAQSAGGLAGATTTVRYSPLALPQVIHFRIPGRMMMVVRLGSLDASGYTLTYTIVTPPTHGSIHSLDPIHGTVVYFAGRGPFSGDSFSFSVNDGVLSSDPATVTILPFGPIHRPH